MKAPKCKACSSSSFMILKAVDKKGFCWYQCPDCGEVTKG